MLVITSKRELIDTLDARIARMLRAQRMRLDAVLTPRERERLAGAIGELTTIRDILNDAAINISDPTVERAITTPRDNVRIETVRRWRQEEGI